MTKFYNLFFFLLLPLLAASQSEQLSNFEGATRQGAVSLSLGNFGYVGLGNNGSTYYSDFWQYNPADDSWTELAPFPGESRSYGVAFAIDEFIYVGLGSKYAGGTTFYSDFHKYSPTENEWTAIESFGGGERSAVVAFVIDNFAYVGTGSSPDGDKKDFWKYNSGDNSWSQVADAPDAKNSAIGFSINGKGYLVAGITYSPYTDQYSDVQEYSPTENNWTERVYADGMNLPFTGATNFVLNGEAYIAYGNMDFVTIYNPQTNQVTNKGDLIGIGTSREKPCSFVIDGVAYFGLGSWMESWTNTIYYNDFWKYTPPLPEPEVLNLTGGGSYCNGVSPTGISAQIANSQMQIFYQLKKDGANFGDVVEGTGGAISWENLEAGSYTALGSNGEENVEMNGTVIVQEISLVEATVEITADELDVCQGQSVMVTASITNGGLNPSYTWYVNDIEQSEQTDAFNYEPSNNDIVACELTSNEVCVSNSPILSNELAFTTQNLIEVSIDITAESLEICDGHEIAISTTPTNGGENPYFIWFVNSQNQQQNTPTFTYTPEDGDKVICNLVTDIACPAQNPAISNELEITVVTCTGVDVDITKGISVYPNPIKSQVMVEMQDGERIQSIKVIAIDGRVIKTQKYSKPTQSRSLDLCSLTKGTYFLVVQGENLSKTVKIIKD